MSENSIVQKFSICEMGDNSRDLGKQIAAIYNFSEVPLILTLEVVVVGTLQCSVFLFRMECVICSRQYLVCSV